jgi:hypothetical protein
MDGPFVEVFNEAILKHRLRMNECVASYKSINSWYRMDSCRRLVRLKDPSSSCFDRRRPRPGAVESLKPFLGTQLAKLAAMNLDQPNFKAIASHFQALRSPNPSTSTKTRRVHNLSTTPSREAFLLSHHSSHAQEAILRPCFTFVAIAQLSVAWCIR